MNTLDNMAILHFPMPQSNLWLCGSLKSPYTWLFFLWKINLFQGGFKCLGNRLSFRLVVITHNSYHLDLLVDCKGKHKMSPLLNEHILSRQRIFCSMCAHVLLMYPLKGYIMSMFVLFYWLSWRASLYVHSFWLQQAQMLTGSKQSCYFDKRKYRTLFTHNTWMSFTAGILFSGLYSCILHGVATMV